LRLQELQNRYRELATERVEQRVARAILRLVRQSGKEVEDGVQIEFPLSRQDIAEMTGTTLHTVSRLLSSWEQIGLLDGGRMRIVLRKPRALLAIAEDLRPVGVRPV
jgi:CRP/FNR family transcriptional regulator, nitrogen oxide reductase regulator